MKLRPYDGKMGSLMDGGNDNKIYPFLPDTYIT